MALKSTGADNCETKVLCSNCSNEAGFIFRREVRLCEDCVLENMMLFCENNDNRLTTETTYYLGGERIGDTQDIGEVFDALASEFPETISFLERQFAS